MSYNPTNWYWVVAGSTTQVFSSASGTYVAISDSTYTAWLANNHPSRVVSEAELSAVLAQQAPGVVVGSPAGLAAYAAAKQAAIAAGGISVGGVKASTDIASLVLLQGAVSVATANGSAAFNWVPSVGAPVTLTAAQVIAIFGAVSTFLQATFTALSTVVSAINAGTITTRSGVDSATWPANS